ncbi:MAG: TonB-dependent receptor [Rhodocyclaceae bacterium]|nr:TonB-dependent receptor [Rhodocyclaceae bacterium]
MTPFFKLAPLTVAMISVFPFAATAQTAAPATQLPEVKVTAKKDASLTQPNIDTAKAEMAKVAGGTNIIDAETFREGRVSTFSDTLGMATGVLAQSRFGAEETRLSIRGSGLQRTFHLRGIKLMQDGVQINQADGGGDFQSIEPLATRYIEVFRGANALRYGASTLGGAVNFVSPTGHDAPKLELRAETGSYGYQRLGFATGGVSDNGVVDYFLSGSTFDQNGFRDHAGQSAQRMNGNVGYRISDDIETRFYVGYAKSDSFLPGSLTMAQLRANPRQANPSTVSGNNKRDIEVFRVANKTTIRLGDNRIELGAWYADKTLFHPIFQVLDQQNADYGLDLRYIANGKLFGYANEFVLGFAPSRGTTRDDRFTNVGGQRGARTNKLYQVANNIELYGENRLRLNDQFTVIAGLQYTRATRKNRDEFFAAGQDESFNVSYTGTSPKIGVLYQATPSVQWFANLSRSYEPPSFGELTGGLTPNINRAQRGGTLEVGSRGQSRDVDWDVSVYHARLRNELLQSRVFVAGNSGAAAPQTTNADSTIHSGVELGLTARLPGKFEWRNNLLINHFRFDGDRQFGNNTLPGVPKVLLRGELLHRDGAGFYAGPTIEAAGDYPIDMSNSVNAPGYTIFGFKLGHQVKRGMSWFVEARNLADKKYVSTTGVIRNLGGADSAQFLPGDGRSVYAGIQWRQ